jgi:hypothetical protein
MIYDIFSLRAIVDEQDEAWAIGADDRHRVARRNVVRGIYDTSGGVRPL